MGHMSSSVYSLRATVYQWTCWLSVILRDRIFSVAYLSLLGLLKMVLSSCVNVAHKVTFVISLLNVTLEMMFGSYSKVLDCVDDTSFICGIGNWFSIKH